MNALDYSGSSAAHYAAKRDNSAMFEELLLLGADPNETNPVGLTPLLCAVIRNDPAWTARLLQHGALVDLKAPGTKAEVSYRIKTDLVGDLDYDAEKPELTPLQLAANRGLPQIVQVLLSQGGADPNIRDSNSHTALHHARRAGNLQNGNLHSSASTGCAACATLLAPVTKHSKKDDCTVM